MLNRILSFLPKRNKISSLQTNVLSHEILKYNLCLCCIIKDENVYLEEWISYHLKTGVEHFYIYDNGSKIPISDTLTDLKLSEYTTVTKMPGKAKQISAYEHCLKNFGRNCQWIGFIDTDEFIVAKTTYGDLQAFLKDYKDYGGLGINWLVFGSNGHEKKPGRPQLESFTMRAEKNFHLNQHIKNIVQPEFVKSVLGAHHFEFVKGKYCVNENFDPIDGAFSETSVTKIQLNHYYCRSREEYEHKIQRGYGDTSKKRTLDEFFNHDRDANKVQDLTILELFKSSN
jgi:hypothetical protein